MFHKLGRNWRFLGTALLLFFAMDAACNAAPSAMRIRPGDKLQVTVFNHPDLSSEMTVSSSGQVRVAVAGTVQVAGLSESAASARLATAFAAFLYHPSVDVRIASQGQSIFFTGSLVGVQPYLPGETLAAAIGAFRQTLSTQAAGVSSSVGNVNNIDLRSVRLEHEGNVSAPFDIETLSRYGDSGPVLAPGDVVMLRAKPVRVDVRGSLPTPTAVYVYPGDTLAQALAEAGPLPPSTSLATIGLQRDGATTVVSSAGSAFTEPAHDGDLLILQPAPRVSVLGMVDKSGDQILQTRATLLSALYEAGGPNRFADLAHVRITHTGETRTVNISRLTHGDISENPVVYDGDVIFVPEGRKIDFAPFTNALGALGAFRL